MIEVFTDGCNVESAINKGLHYHTLKQTTTTTFNNQKKTKIILNGRKNIVAVLLHIGSKLFCTTLLSLDDAR